MFRGTAFGVKRSSPVEILTIDLLEHLVHDLHVRVVEEPDRGVVVILLEWHCDIMAGNR